MLLARIQFDYGVKFTKEKIEQLNAVLPFDKCHKEAEEGQEVDLWENFIMYIEEAAQFGAFKVLNLLTTKPAELKEIERGPVPVVNERCHVSVPGMGLLLIDEVKLNKDCCTDYLQSELNDGWKILAICVQPDQRRPDYIMGRASETKNKLIYSH